MTAKAYLNNMPILLVIPNRFESDYELVSDANTWTERL